MPYRKPYRNRKRPYRKGRASMKFRPRKGSMLSDMLYRKSNPNYLYRPRRGINYTGLPKSAFMAEKKLLALTKQNEKPTAVIQTGALASHVGFVIGSKPTQWNGQFHDLHGIAIPKGDDQDQRNGQYVFLSHSNIFFNVDTEADSTTKPPMECRVIVFKARRAANPAGVAYDPSVSLFLDDLGNQIGHATTGVDGFDLTRRVLNRRDWYILRDQRFMLSKPLTNDSDGGNVMGYTGKYPSCKNFRFKLPYMKKARYDTSNLPTDCAYHWGILVYVRSISKDSQTASQVEVNLRGNTVFLDP